jgi:prepilin-type N-terminal cleavage/methylation domain-containing protein
MKAEKKSGGFTLIELLVSMAILALMVAALAQLSGLTTSTVSQELRKADSFSKARAVLDVFSQDIANGVFRPDLAAFRDQGGGFASAFYSRRAAIGGDRKLSLLAYDTDAATATLLRASSPVVWNDTTGIGFGSPTTLARLATISSADYQPIVEGVVRMEYFFLDDQGNYQAQYDASTRAVGIALAIVDAPTLDLLKKSNSLASIQTLLKQQTPVPSESYLTFWGNLLNGSEFANYPGPVRSGLRIFERIIPLPT